VKSPPSPHGILPFFSLASHFFFRHTLHQKGATSAFVSTGPVSLPFGVWSRAPPITLLPEVRDFVSEKIVRFSPDPPTVTPFGISPPLRSVEYASLSLDVGLPSLRFPSPSCQDPPRARPVGRHRTYARNSSLRPFERSAFPKFSMQNGNFRPCSSSLFFFVALPLNGTRQSQYSRTLYGSWLFLSRRSDLHELSRRVLTVSP